MKKVLALMSALVIAITSLVGGVSGPINASGKNMKAAFELISDTHIDCDELVVQNLVKEGIQDIKDAECKINGVVVAGDITNYGDAKSLDTFYSIMKGVCTGKRLIAAAGNHDIGHAEERGLTNSTARKNFINKFNKFSGRKTDKIYYSATIDGYTFIVLSDESKDNWDSLTLSKTQLNFLDAQLKKYSKSKKPVFVVCHWPTSDPHGLKTVDEDIILDEALSKKIHNILKKYNNVFYISGHAHTGVNGEFTKENFSVKYVSRLNGVTYVNLPTFGLVNRYGTPWPCTGVHLEVYSDKVVLRPRNYSTGKWIADYNVTVKLK